MTSARPWLICSTAVLVAVSLSAAHLSLSAVHLGAAELQQPATVASAQSVSGETSGLIDQYCVRCHNTQRNTGGLALDAIDVGNVGENVEVWEKAVRKLRARAMPPAGGQRPDESGYEVMLAYLETSLDRAAAASPDPGRTDTFRRLNRTEYQNAIRDLLTLEVDVTALLPRDDASYGFDNVSLAGLSPTLMERYLSAAQKISRLAVGSAVPAPGSEVVVLSPDLTQEGHFDGLPFGTRGGTTFSHIFPTDGVYTIKVRLARNRNENVEGLTDRHEMEILLDGERLQLFPIVPNRNRLGGYYSDEDVDKGLEVELPVTSGPHNVSVTFLRRSAALIESTRQPYQAQFNMDRHPRQQPAVYSVAIAGPFEQMGPGETPSRDRVFTCRPATQADEPGCAHQIISTLAQRAYRRPVTEEDLEVLLDFYADARAESGFEAGIEMALRALLTSTEFLFRIERDPDGLSARTAYDINDFELASRLSFFLWSSIPDEELLDVAAGGGLSDPVVLAAQVQRLLADPRAEALTTNFAGQWLHLRNLDASTPNLRLFPDFDDNLRQGFRRETELLFESIHREDRSVLTLIDADYTFLNERLAKHYGVPNVYGDRFQRVELGEDSPRAGLLGHGSVLTVTSYATRTSPVLRGKWILDNLLGMPPGDPPPNVPELEEPPSGQAPRSMRERMIQHRVNPACAVCHELMDPAGLSMENFDAIGRWRDRSEDGTPIDASGSLPGGVTFEGVAGLRQAVLARPEVFVGRMTEKLLTYGLGRGVDYHDAPAVREIVRTAASDDYSFSSLILAIVESPPFQMRRSQ